MPKKDAQISLEGLREQLTYSSKGLWVKTKPTGSGSKEEDFREIKTYWYLAEKEDIRLKVTVEMQSGVITYIGTDTEILTDQMNKVIRDEQVESTFGISGMLGSKFLCDDHCNISFSLNECPNSNRIKSYTGFDYCTSAISHNKGRYTTNDSKCLRC